MATKNPLGCKLDCGDRLWSDFTKTFHCILKMQIKTQYTHWSGDLGLHAFLSDTPGSSVSNKVFYVRKFSTVPSGHKWSSLRAGQA